MVKRVVFWSAVLGACLVQAETIAFYPLTEKEPGTALSKTSADVKNAIDAELYAGTAFGVKAYGTEVPAATYSDDIPGAFLYEGPTSEEVLVENYQSVLFPDFAASEESPLAINEAKRTADVTHQVENSNGTFSLRPRGATMLVLAGLDAAISGLENWTIECFIKHDSCYTG